MNVVRRSDITRTEDTSSWGNSGRAGGVILLENSFFLGGGSGSKDLI